MKKLFVHIGMHKTGSTSIQQSFASLDDGVVRYMRLGNSNHSAIHSTIFLSAPEKYHGHKRNGRTAEDVRKIQDVFIQKVENEIANAETRSLITSGEDISIMDEDALIRMRDFFGRHFDDIKIIGYVRPPGSLMASALQQRLAGGQSVRIDSLYPHYRARFEKFDRVFGKENVLLKKFQTECLESGNVVIDFSRIIGTDFPEDRVIRSNEGRGREVAALLYARRTLIERDEDTKIRKKTKDRTIQLLKLLNSESLRLHRDAIVPILDQNRDDIEWMESRLGASLAETYSDDDNAVRDMTQFLTIAGSLAPDLGHLLSENIKQIDKFRYEKLEPRFLTLLSFLAETDQNLMAEVVQRVLTRKNDPKAAALAVDLLFDVVESQG